MRLRSAIVYPVLLASTVTIFAMGGVPGRAKFTRDQVQDDFRILRAALEEGHPGIYRFTGKAEMDGVFEQAARCLDHAMDAYEFFRFLSTVVAPIKCGHTEVLLPEESLREVDDRESFLPLQVRLLDLKVYVLRDLANADNRLAAREILSVNGVPTPVIVAMMLMATPGDGDIITSRQMAIGGLRFAQNLVTLLGLRSPYHLRLEDRETHEVESVRLSGSRLSDLREIAKARSTGTSARGPDFTLLEDGRIAVMRILEFSGLDRFLRDSFEEMDRRKTEALILDVRNNGGGDDDQGKLLLSYLIDKPFQYYSDLVVNSLSFDFAKYATGASQLPAENFQQGADGRYHLVGHPNWGLQQPTSPTFRGDVLVLMNGGSFSTTAEFLSQAHYHHRATFIGEESGGGYYGNTSGFMPILTLPHSKLRVVVPLVRYRIAVSGCKEPSHGVIPDREVRYTIEDVLAGRDKEMELALYLLDGRHNEIAPPSSMTQQERIPRATPGPAF